MQRDLGDDLPSPDLFVEAFAATVARCASVRLVTDEVFRWWYIHYGTNHRIIDQYLDRVIARAKEIRAKQEEVA